jgi:CubicO group peptidase (beta-lactamase class C family)
MNCTIKNVWVICISALLFSCSSAANKKQEAKVEEPPVPIIPISISYSALSDKEKENWTQIIRSFYDTIIAKKLNGQILIAKNGVILFEAYIGNEVLNSSTSKLMNEHSPIHLASVSKTFTASAILLLQQQGKLSIDDLVTKYLPNFPYPEITIKMLLNHRSGLINYVHNLENWKWPATPMATNQDILNLIIQFKPPLNYKPNTKFLYCNTNYAMLALIIEKVSGKSYPKYMHDNIFHPLQMNDTYVFEPKDSAKALPSYDWKGRMMVFNNLDGVYGDKNIYSTVKDLYKWDQALYSDKILTPASKKMAYEPYSFEKPGIKNYGLGWRMFNFPNNKKLIFHNGWWHGNNNAFIRLVEDSATLICLGSKFSRSNYSVMGLTYLFGDYPFEYEVEEGKDTAKANEILLLNQLKLRADSLKALKKITPIVPVPVKKKDTTKVKIKDTAILNNKKELEVKKDSTQ